MTLSLDLFIEPALATLMMTFVAGVIAALLGVPLGFYLFLSSRQRSLSLIGRSVNLLVNLLRSVPFILLVVALIPFTRILTGTSIGKVAALVPLSIAAIPFVARSVETVLNELPTSLFDTAESMGASSLQLIQYFLWSESLPGLIRVVTSTLINLVAYTAMAGALGAGGLGDLAIRYGYQRYETSVLAITLVLLILLVESIQVLGNYFAHRFERGG